MPDQEKLEKREEKREDKVTRMGTAPIGKLMLEFSIPAVAAVVLNSLYNVIDSIFLGQAMGEIGLAATQVAFPIMTIVNAFAILAGNGGNSLAAILLGEGRKDDAERALGNSVTVMIIVSIAAAIYATFWIDPLLILVGATDVTLPYARTFIQIIIYGMMICNISFGVNNFIRTAGAPNLALWTTVVGTVVCHRSQLRIRPHVRLGRGGIGECDHHRSSRHGNHSAVVLCLTAFIGPFQASLAQSRNRPQNLQAPHRAWPGSLRLAGGNGRDAGHQQHVARLARRG